MTIETEEFEEVKMTAAELKTTWTWSYPMGKDNNAIPTKRKINHNQWWVDSSIKPNEYNKTDPHQSDQVDWKKENDLDMI